MSCNKTIFLSTGRTFTFRNVTDVVENETSLTFGYTAMSDSNKKVVTFYRPEIVGHSTYEFGTDVPASSGCDVGEAVPF